MGSQKVGHDWVTELNWNMHCTSALTIKGKNFLWRIKWRFFQRLKIERPYVLACWVAWVTSDSWQRYGLWLTRLLCPWDSPGKNTGMDCHALLQEIFLAQGSNPCLLCLLYLQVCSLPLAQMESPEWSYDPVTPLLGTYLEKTIIQKDTFTPLFIAALFTIARTWKSPKCPSTKEWIKKMWYTYTTSLVAGEEGNDRGWDGWVAPPNQWTWGWQTPGHGEEQGSLACCSPWSHKESDMIEQQYICNGILLSHKKWFAGMWMDIETVI